MALYCSGCGVSLPVDARFCSACGKPVLERLLFLPARPLHPGDP